MRLSSMSFCNKTTHAVYTVIISHRFFLYKSHLNHFFPKRIYIAIIHFIFPKCIFNQNANFIHKRLPFAVLLCTLVLYFSKNFMRLLENVQSTVVKWRVYLFKNRNKLRNKLYPDSKTHPLFLCFTIRVLLLHLRKK